MARRETRATAPARLRKGLPLVADGSRASPLLVTLGDDALCNNGCNPCVTGGRPTDASLDRRHVVIRDREATLRDDLPARVAELAARAATLTLLTNGRLLVYADRARALRQAGLDRVIVKLFGSDATTHDAHTRVEGSFHQALQGIANARAAGLETHVTFPQPVDDEALAERLTDHPAVVFPEPQVVAHAGEYRVDLVALREGAGEIFTRWFFPMAHVQTGPRCNLRCVYCNVHGGDDPRLFEADYVKSLVVLAASKIDRSRGRATIDFIGGEPTLHPDLAELIRHARTRFDEVSICTNGVLLHKRPEMLDALIDAGLTMIRYSLHSHETEDANALADVRGLDDAYVDNAKRLLARTDVHTHFYRILLRDTVASLPAYMRFLSAHNRTGKPIDLSLGMPSMRGRLFENPHLVPDLDSVRTAAREAIALAPELGIELFLHHTPACLVPEAPERASCLNVTTLQVDADVEEALSFEGDARYVPACEGCGAKSRGCHGIPAAYFDAGQPVDAWAQPIDPDTAEIHYARRADVTSSR